VTEEWIVRVEGKEYGPVDTDVLREWKREGRLIPTNELRRVEDQHWTQAGQLSDIFVDSDPTPVPPPLPPADFERARTWREILAETFRIYRSGFMPLILFGLLTSVPMFMIQLTFPKIPLPDFTAGVPATIPTPQVPPVSWLMVLLFLLVWPVSTAGFQFVADDILRRRSNPFGAQFSTALRYWGRMSIAALVVYASYFFWLFIPFSGMLAFANGVNPFLALPLIMLIGGFMVYIVARLFINFLFWQQTVTIGNDPPLLALRQSKELARSAPEAGRFDRPLYRGAIIASAWLLLLLVLTFCVQLPFALARFIGVGNTEEAMALMRKMSEAQTPDSLMMAANIAAAAINLLLRPLLAAAFVVLYYDAKARSGRTSDAEIGSNE
jgi:hypothetical protein